MDLGGGGHTRTEPSTNSDTHRACHRWVSSRDMCGRKHRVRETCTWMERLVRGALWRGVRTGRSRCPGGSAWRGAWNIPRRSGACQWGCRASTCRRPAGRCRGRARYTAGARHRLRGHVCWLDQQGGGRGSQAGSTGFKWLVQTRPSWRKMRHCVQGLQKPAQQRSSHLGFGSRVGVGAGWGWGQDQGSAASTTDYSSTDYDYTTRFSHPWQWVSGMPSRLRMAARTWRKLGVRGAGYGGTGNVGTGVRGYGWG